MARADAEIDPATTTPDASPNGNGAVRSPFKVRLPARRERARKAPKLRPSYERRYRQTVRKIDLWSVLKLSICFYLTALAVVLFAGVVLWWIASAFGIISDIENFVGELVNSEDFEFLSWNVLRASALVGLVLVCLQVVCTVLAAALYNFFSTVLGGIEITVVEDEAIGSK
jgi:hypothetical protein